jgi:hypothetical protein
MPRNGSRLSQARGQLAKILASDPVELVKLYAMICARASKSFGSPIIVLK